MPTTTYSKGDYLAEIIAQGFEESLAKRTPFFFFQLKIAGRYDEQDQLQACPEYERTYRQYLANAAGAGILKCDLRALGVEVDDLTRLHPDAPDHISLVGRRIKVACDLEVYQGKEQERWSIPRSQKGLDLSSVRALNEKFKQVFGNGDRRTGPAGGVTEPSDNGAAS